MFKTMKKSTRLRLAAITVTGNQFAVDMNTVKHHNSEAVNEINLLIGHIYNLDQNCHFLVNHILWL